MNKSTKTSAKANTKATTTKRKYTKRATTKAATTNTSKLTVNKPTVTVAEIISHTKTHIVAKWENKLITVEL
jgi:hypothetical protein